MKGATRKTQNVPRNFPPEPEYREAGSNAEKQVWAALQTLPDDAVVIAQYRVLDTRRVTREADFVVLIPDVGIGVVEVKGGQVWTESGEWFSRNWQGYDYSIKNPMLQALKAGFAIADFVHDQQFAFDGWVPVVVLPDTDLSPRFYPADSLRGQWIDAAGMPDLVSRLQAAIYSDAPPNAADVQELAAILEQRLPKPVAWQTAQAANAHADILTRDQYAILRAVRTNDRILVTGGPGTGKTWLALEHARQETLRGARVAVVCYNRGLALYMGSQTASWPEDHRPAFVGTLHQLALDWTGTAIPDDADSVFWDALPGQLQVAAAARSDDDRFDLVVVDEAQDFATQWWPAVREVLCDPEGGPMVVFGDEDQELYGRGALGVPAFEVTLDENVRNTVQIVGVLEALAGEAQQCRGAKGPPVEFLECVEDTVVEVADQAVAALLAGDQFRACDVVLLTTKRRHPIHEQRLSAVGPMAFAQSLLGEDVAVCTVKGFKGLERPVVVLAINGFHSEDEARTLLRVGVSRATHLLVLVGEPRWLVQLGSA